MENVTEPHTTAQDERLDDGVERDNRRGESREEVPLAESGAVDLMYFRDMSQAPAPSRHLEVELATRIDTARQAIVRMLTSPPPGLRTSCDGYRRLRAEPELLDPACPDAFAEQLLGEVETLLRARGRNQTLKTSHRAGVRRLAADLRREVSALNRAKSDLTECNLRLVVHIANRYRQQQLPLIDLIQEGNLGLMKAVEKFDVSRGYRFSTYAVWWIRQYIKRALENHGAVIRTPIYVQDARKRIARTRQELSLRLGRSPTLDEIAAEEDLTAERIEELLTLRTDTVSLDEPTPGREDGVLGDLIEDAGSPSPFDRAADSQIARAVSRALETLTPREETILRLRFGIGTEEPAGQTLREISRVFDLTHERIRQIEAKALERLRDILDEDALMPAPLPD